MFLTFIWAVNMGQHFIKEYAPLSCSFCFYKEALMEKSVVLGRGNSWPSRTYLLQRVPICQEHIILSHSEWTLVRHPRPQQVWPPPKNQRLFLNHFLFIPPEDTPSDHKWLVVNKVVSKKKKERRIPSSSARQKTKTVYQCVIIGTNYICHCLWIADMFHGEIKMQFLNEVTLS